MRDWWEGLEGSGAVPLGPPPIYESFYEKKVLLCTEHLLFNENRGNEMKEERNWK